MYMVYFHYKRQKNHVYRVNAPYPIICDIPYFYKYLKNTENKHAVVKWGEIELGPHFNKTAIKFLRHEPVLRICDVNVVEQLYTTHNALFDKHPFV